MKILFDTSTLLAALLKAHPAHHVCYAWLEHVQAGKVEADIQRHFRPIYPALSNYIIDPSAENPAQARTR